MNHTLRICLPLALLTIVAAAGCSSDGSAFSSSDAAVDDRPSTGDASLSARQSVTVTSLGRVPTGWRIGGAWAFSAPLGSASDDYASFTGVLDTVLAPAHRYSLRDDVIGHAVAHVGPYADEVERAMRGLDRPPTSVFRARDYTAPQGIYSLVLIEATPTAPRGPSQDGPNQPVVAAELFPFTVRGSVLLDGRVFDPDTSVSMLNAPPSAVERSAPPTHFFNIIGNSNEFGRRNAVLSGAWTMPLNVVDQSGAGYRVEIAFRIECDDADRRATPDLCGASAQP